jgi:hypothetical protein
VRDLPDEPSERVLFDRDDLVTACRLLHHPHLRWTIGMALSAEPADRDARRQCREALVEAIQKQQGAELARGVRLAMLLLAVGLEPAQPTDESP